MKIIATIFAVLALLASLAQAETASDEPELRSQVLQHREDEAQAKARSAAAAAAARASADRTPNQDLYDAQYYELDLDLNPDSHILSGNVTARAEVLSSISTLDLNLDNGMSVSAVTSAGLATSWSHGGNILTIDLDRVYAAGETVEVAVTYSGNPSGSNFGWDSHAGQDMIWTLSEPYGARTWWPCKDLNTDKADSVDIIVTVPDELIVASNGSLLSDVDHGATRTFHWQESYPIVTYLVSLAIYPYTVFHDSYTPQGGGEPMDLAYYVYPDHYDDVQANYALVDDMIAVFAQGYGEYPFLGEKYGHAEFTWGGGMEHQTISSMGGWSEDLISHELAHQWWGDMVTCADFGHIWLNEGFATWSEAYWKEQTAGFSTYQAYMDYAAYYGPGTIFVEDPSDFWDIFNSSLSYNKASWVVHMVRHVVGDEDFFDGLAHYRDLYGYGSATTEDFRDAMEDVSGLDLDAFFQQWIYGEYFPVYRYEWSQDGATLNLNIEQIQTNTGLFTMPIDVQVETDSGTQIFVVQNSLASEDYQLTVSGQVQAVLLDPEKWILRSVETTVTNPTFDEGILLVNGVHWNTYWSDITAAYEARAFWGDNEISFWDNFSAPGGGYPSTLPEPLGHGEVPADVIGAFSTVIWVGNNYNGDLPKWQETPISSYLETGGNLLLLSRRSQSFLAGELADYLGITWAESESNLGNCIAVHPDLVDIPFTGTQSWNDVFQTSVGPQSTLLFKDTAGFSGDRGTGVHAQPIGGGSHRPEGAQFVHLAGRPYRMQHAALRDNVEFILENYFEEPWAGQTALPGEGAASVPRLSANWPNPFNPRTSLAYEITTGGEATLAVYDINGRLVKVLLSGVQEAGTGTVDWNGLDEGGRAMASGIYLARLETGETSSSRAMVLLR